MKNLLALIVVNLSFHVMAYDKELAIKSFSQKVAINPIVVVSDPYDQKPGKIDHDSVCGIRYLEDRVRYRLQTFASKREALESGFIVTHFGVCGSCSTLKDLAAYLTHKDLTAPVRKCSIKLMKKRRLSCLRKLGLTDSCSKSWQYNASHTRKKCFGVCVKSWIRNEPYNLPDGSLNPCLACDERESGPVFKWSAGRTRRNSGLESAIARPSDQIVEVQHDYY